MTEHEIKKAIIFDSSTIISLAMNSLYDELRKLKENFDGSFLITKEVKQEIIDKPITIKRFELEALKIKQLLDEKILEMPDEIGVKNDEISKKTNDFLNISNMTFQARGDNIHIIDLGEASCIALSQILNSKKINNIIAADERTLRMLVEKPENLGKLMQSKFHTPVESKKQNFISFKGFKIIRSAELIYAAYKKGFVNLKNGSVLDALLYAVKFKGCSISDDEIEEIKKLK